MNKFTVKSKTQVFGGLYFRTAHSHSIEWTSFEKAAYHFDCENHAMLRMMELGIHNFTTQQVDPNEKVN